jgi:hypothetical protein
LRLPSKLVTMHKSKSLSDVGVPKAYEPNKKILLGENWLVMRLVKELISVCVNMELLLTTLSLYPNSALTLTFACAQVCPSPKMGEGTQ